MDSIKLLDGTEWPLNTAYNGDCLDFMRLLPDKCIDYGFTSPPYNRKRNDKYENYVDIVEDYYGWMVSVIDDLLRICKENIFFNIQATMYNRTDVYRLIGNYGEKIKDIIIWEKTNPMPAAGNAITNAVEYFIVIGDIPLRSKRTYTKNILSTSVNGEMPDNHKAVMKKEVADYFFYTFMEKGKTVIDPFIGMFTTAISANQNGLNWIGCEKDPDYFKTGTERYKTESEQTFLSFD